MSQAEKESIQADGGAWQAPDDRVFIINPAYKGNSSLGQEADNRITQVIGFLEIVACHSNVGENTPDALSNAAWGAQELLSEARELQNEVERRLRAELEAALKKDTPKDDPRAKAVKAVGVYRDLRVRAAQLEKEALAELRKLGNRTNGSERGVRQ